MQGAGAARATAKVIPSHYGRGPTINLNIDRRIFNPIYLPYLFKDSPRTQVFFGGSSSGKSVFLAQRAVLDVAASGRNYLVVRNVQKTLRLSAFNEISKAISQFKLSRFFNINKSDMMITCANGYQILFAGLDDVEKIKSITPQKGVITDIWVEEATEAGREDVKQLSKRLRGLVSGGTIKKRLSMSFNPILQDHWICSDYFGQWQDDSQRFEDRNISILKTTYRDNKFLAPDDIYELENEPDKYFYDVYTLGNWGVLGQVIFKNWRVEDLSKMRRFFDRHKNGLDFGFGGHPAGLVHTHWDKNHKRIYVLDELYVYELTNDLLAEEVKKIVGRQPVVCDSAEPKSIRELRNFGVTAIGAKKGKDSVNFGIQWLQRQDIVVDVGCQNMINELRKYKWKEDKNGTVLPVPVDRDDHLIDSLRYAYEDQMLESQPARALGKKPRGW